MHLLRQILVLILSLLLGLTPAAALELGMSSPGGTELVICAEGGAKTITLDENGAPVTRHDPHCHDCCLVVGDTAFPATLPQLRLSRQPLAALPAPVTVFTGPALPRRSGRGPPLGGLT